MSDVIVPSSDTADLGALQTLAADALAEATRLGASAAETGVSASAGLSVTVRMGEVETIEHTRDKSLGVTVYFGQRKASASTTDFSPSAVRETVNAACTLARYTADRQDLLALH